MQRHLSEGERPRRPQSFPRPSLPTGNEDLNGQVRAGGGCARERVAVGNAIEAQVDTRVVVVNGARC